MNTFQRIAINTGGGDAPGVIHAAVQLYKALGGGWENMEPSASAAVQTTPPAK
jgi:hypothetical protein